MSDAVRRLGFKPSEGGEEEEDLPECAKHFVSNSPNAEYFHISVEYAQ